jgi:hypothetical protein
MLLVGQTLPAPAAKHDEGGSIRAQREELRWQRRVLPLMSGLLVLLAAVFIVISTMQTRELQTQAGKIESLDMEKALSEIVQRHQHLGYALNDDQIRWEALAVLEAQSLNRRYSHARVLLTESIWTRFLGFITGMILALIGAGFVLGKLRESGSTLAADTSLWKMSVSTASPGIMLAVLGTMLMLSTILVKHEITVNDGMAYLQPAPVANVASPSTFPAPPSLPPSLPGEGDQVDQVKPAPQIGDTTGKKKEGTARSGSR